MGKWFYKTEEEYNNEFNKKGKSIKKPLLISFAAALVFTFIEVVGFPFPYMMSQRSISSFEEFLASLPLINYAIPDGRIIPFCTMNTIHRSRVEDKFAMPISEWRNRHKPSQVEEESISKPYEG